MDTDDQSVLQVLSDEKYKGLLAEDGGNVHVTSVYEWDDYQKFSDQTAKVVKKGDFIVLDFVSDIWSEAQDDFVRAFSRENTGRERSKDELMIEAGIKNKQGWDMWKEIDMNWNAVNSAYRLFTKPLLVQGPAHVIMVAKGEKIQEGGKMTDDAKEHVAQFGSYKARGQKGLAYECRSFIRVQRLARGRVLYTLKDRARKEFSGETMTDFFQSYLVGAGKWQAV